MSKTARTDEIDELVSSVRNFVSHKEPQRSEDSANIERLVLTPDQRVNQIDSFETPVFVDVIDRQALQNSHVPAIDQTAGRAGLEATIAELEAAVTAQSEDWEPDEGESFEQAAWAVSAFQIPSGDSESPTTDTVPQVAGVSDEPETEAEEFDSNDVVSVNKLAADITNGIDDAALRALVVEIVQDELGGELGERITRNVRKLVRREINRFLASREMGQE